MDKNSIIYRGDGVEINGRYFSNAELQEISVKIFETSTPKHFEISLPPDYLDSSKNPYRETSEQILKELIEANKKNEQLEKQIEKLKSNTTKQIIIYLIIGVLSAAFGVVMTLLLT